MSTVVSSRADIASLIASIRKIRDNIQMKAVVFTRAALKAFGSLPKAAQIAIVAKLERYAEDGAGNTKALVGQPGIRLRIGTYRAIFIETEAMIEVFAVGDRRDIYE